VTTKPNTHFRFKFFYSPTPIHASTYKQIDYQGRSNSNVGIMPQHSRQRSTMTQIAHVIHSTMVLICRHYRWNKKT